jgi:hypothetical protein
MTKLFIKRAACIGLFRMLNIFHAVKEIHSTYVPPLSIGSETSSEPNVLLIPFQILYASHIGVFQPELGKGGLIVEL